ncbi:exodeoxyribonuclease VII large subunit [Pelodictyon phaeoclathratiforme]|jgi:exodeoxyribonuclease VII large subunit|uniref:Exodeoxyribonuclease 7 large subunit n=1 Tax=Pelodictyon phaeoclathratiforme (strain DSM 5477 / BU-1) TaxID=324925 RepID=B4SES5_PELPB|nr:exodeoxyribonuclease VII large subunit [Pelodictyon phaeoclathratiforme]ACF44601.1 exodeoxyribonuclease VII, large subunit [Pelodictyon phaeoclathratiforme BU-1]MBV5288977.1 exodeoxyribonuclease VII large subunit [Pelodictyon phaeoclathratiforme]
MSAEILSVSELTQQIKTRLETHFPQVRLKGEISNCKRHGSGHIYLTLKDEGAQIPAVVWKTTASRMAVALKDGMDVIAEGRLEVYPPSGRYQLICTSVTEAGQGALQQAFAELLQKLAKAGYFNAERKRAIPAIPEIIGLITSSTGAVIEDMSKVFERRFPAAQLLLYPVKVQGNSAAEEVAAAIAWFNSTKKRAHRPDIIIIARGGGSLEDLQAFNGEIVANALYNSKIPVISAIGHETDLTIADMVADLRAGTPSIAAELAVPDRQELLRHISNLQSRQDRLLQAKLEGTERQLSSICSSYAFNRPPLQMLQFHERLDSLVSQMSRAITNLFSQRVQHYAAVKQQLNTLDYRKTLERGYVLVKKEGKFMTGSQKLKASDNVELLFHDGMLPAVISPAKSS